MRFVFGKPLTSLCEVSISKDADRLGPRNSLVGEDDSEGEFEDGLYEESMSTGGEVPAPSCGDNQTQLLT